MGSLIEDLADNLGKRTSRRGFFRLAAKVTGAMTAVGLGLATVTEQALAASACCTFAFPNNICPQDPGYYGCPGGTVGTYNWSCCYSGCYWTCYECYYNQQRTSGCSYAAPAGASCGGSNCPSVPVRQVAVADGGSGR